MSILNPYVIIGALVTVILCAGGGYIKGRSDANAHCAATIAEMQRKSQEQKDAEAAKAHDASADLEKKDAKAEVVYRTITRTVDRVVDRPVYRNLCLDDDGLRLANAALAGALPDPAEPDAAVP